MLAEIISRLKRPNELKKHVVFNEKILKLVLDNMIKENNIDDRKIYKFDTI